MKFTFDNRGADSPLVEAMWRTTSDAEGSFTSTAIATWELVFTRSNGVMRATLRGPETFSSPALVPADAEFIGIQFKLGTYMPTLPTHQFVDRAIELLGQGGRRTFGFLGKVWEIPRRCCAGQETHQEHDQGSLATASGEGAATAGTV
jgi:hypothetical protein